MHQKLIATKTAALIMILGFVLLVATGLYIRSYYRALPHPVPVRHLADVNAIQDWMTIHYIARAYAVPESILLNAVNVNLQQARHQSLASIARMQHVPLEQIIATVRAAITTYKATQHPATSPNSLMLLPSEKS